MGVTDGRRWSGLSAVVDQGTDKQEINCYSKGIMATSADMCW